MVPNYFLGGALFVSLPSFHKIEIPVFWSMKLTRHCLSQRNALEAVKEVCTAFNRLSLSGENVYGGPVNPLHNVLKVIIG